MAASVAAESHAFEIELPRSQPVLRSSGGNGVVTTNDSGKRFGDRHRDGTGSASRCGSFHSRVIDDLAGGGFSFCFFESSTPCLALEYSSRSGYARPASRNSEPLYSVSLPDFTQASISALLASLTQSRAACSVRTTNSYSPVSG